MPKHFILAVFAGLLALAQPATAQNGGFIGISCPFGFRSNAFAPGFATGPTAYQSFAYAPAFAPGFATGPTTYQSFAVAPGFATGPTTYQSFAVATVPATTTTVTLVPTTATTATATGTATVTATATTDLAGNTTYTVTTPPGVAPPPGFTAPVGPGGVTITPKGPSGTGLDAGTQNKIDQMYNWIKQLAEKQGIKTSQLPTPPAGRSAELDRMLAEFDRKPAAAPQVTTDRGTRSVELDRLLAASGGGK
jgi:hypothetical protein